MTKPPAKTAGSRVPARSASLAMDAVKKRGVSLGVCYANQGYIAGMNGDRALAEDCLQKAELAGCSAAGLATIRKKPGM